MMLLALLRNEVIRVYREPSFIVFTVALPMVLFLVFSSMWGSQSLQGTPAVAYTMVSMACFGAVSASVSAGARIAEERRVGWNRQLRLTPLPGWGYLVGKVGVSLAVALPALLLVGLAGAVIMGVSLPAGSWVMLLGGVWLAVLPFAALGIFIGIFVGPTAVAPVSSGCFLLLSMFGGLWMPLEMMPGWMQSLAHGLPTYWMAELGRSVLPGDFAFGGTGLAVLAAWTVVAGGLATARYLRTASRA